MPSSNPSQEWQRLYDLYAKKGDEELLELRDDFEDLTEVAQDLLRDELRRRKLWADVQPFAAPVEESSDGDPLDGDWTSEDLRLGGVTVGTCNTLEDADLYCFVLERAKINSVVVSGGGKFDVRLPQVKVAPDDEQRGRAILAGPVPDSLINEFKAQAVVQDFEVPVCKKCGSSDVLLEATEPANQWVCDNCGARWQDAALKE